MTPERYKDAEWETVDPRIRDAFRAAIESKKGIYIYGSVGCGKTHIAHALAKRWRETHHASAVLWNVSELIYELKADMDRREKNYTGHLLLNDGRLLILDDIGAERVTDWVAEILYLIVNRRYNDVAPTVFTSNLPIADLAERVGDRIASRIVEMCDMVKMEGGDRRLQQ